MFLKHLQTIWQESEKPFIQDSNGSELFYKDLEFINIEGIEEIKSGDVVALIGDFDSESIKTLLYLLSKNVILVPLTNATESQHEYFIKESKAQYLFKKNKLIKIISDSKNKHPLLEKLRKIQHPGLILFTTGTTGLPKAIIHDFIPFIDRYKTPRPPLKAISFLLFDHIGGINTLLHMLFNLGQIVSLRDRRIETVIKTINHYSVELLPTTPTFLRMMSLYPGIENKISSSLKIISYGTERMDLPTLENLCTQFPKIDFRQTYGMSELGILRIKSKSRNSLFMKIGGEGVEIKTINGILFIKSNNRMLGYLNAKSPFDEKGWYCSKDIVEKDKDGYLKITGRDSDVINIGGLKFLPSQVELECLKIKNVKFAKAYGVPNPITGEYLELNIQLENKEVDIEQVKKTILSNLRQKLPKHMIPSKIKFNEQLLSHRFKKL